MAPDTIDLPSDVQSVLSQLLGTARTAADDRDVETVRETIDTVESVATNEVPESDVRDRLLHGCSEVQRLVSGIERPLTPGERGRVTVGGEYLRSMQSLVASD